MTILVSNSGGRRITLVFIAVAIIIYLAHESLMTHDLRIFVVILCFSFRFKNRFRKPTPGGYRDFFLHIGIKIGDRVDGSPIWFNVELQVHLAALVALDKKNHSHEIYEHFRTYFKVRNEKKFLNSVF